MTFIFEILGTVAFSVSGAITGVKKKMDIFGVVILGIITAVGGGIIRDITIGVTPPMAFRKPVYALVAIAVALITFIPAVRSRINLDHTAWVLVDAVGLGIFTVLGVKAGVPYNNIFLEIFLGSVTGVGGGVIRDICAGELPMIFVRHFYACACIAGAAVCSLLYDLNSTAAMAIGFTVIIILRMLAAKYKWHLPKA